MRWLARNIQITGSGVKLERVLREVINQTARAIRSVNLLLESLVAGIGAIFFASLARSEHRRQRHLIAAFHDRSSIGDHPADVKKEHARNRFQVLLRAGDERIDRIGLTGIRPEDDYMRKHPLDIAVAAGGAPAI